MVVDHGNILLRTNLYGTLNHAAVSIEVIMPSFYAIQSVGFGDLDTYEHTRLFLCFYIIISIVMNAYAIKCFTELLTAQKETRKRKKLLKQMQSLEFVAELSGEQSVGKHQFVLAVLVHLGILDKDRDVTPWMKVRRSARTALLHCCTAPFDCLIMFIYRLCCPIDLNAYACILQKFAASDRDNSGFLNKEVTFVPCDYCLYC